MIGSGNIGWPWRIAVLCSIIAAPFVRFLVQNDYPLGAPEALLGIGSAIAGCVILGLLLRRSFLFAAAVALSVALFSANTARVLLASAVQLRWRLLIPLLAVITAIAAWRLRSVFYNALLVFCAAVLAVDLAQAFIVQRQSPPEQPKAPRAGRLGHIIYLIFDEHIGPEGLPREFSESRRAGTAIQAVLSRHNFDLYPRAYSNYSGTFSSIPSILNRALLAARHAGTAARAGHLAVRDNQLVRLLLSQGYAVRLYESDTLELAPPELRRDVVRVVYKANSVGALTHVPWPWPEKLRHIAGSYFQSDALWSDVGKRAPLLGFRLRPERVGPLAVAGIWPDTLLADVQNAKQNTCFLAHLLTPHYPYVYRADGRWRDRGQWETDDLNDPLPPQTYERRQRQYAEQLEWLSVQLDAFLNGLERAGLYDAARIVIHGDHGSRIRLRRECDEPARRRLQALGDGVERAELYDYTGAPDLQELLNRFSTVLAVKRPGAKEPSVNRRTGSVLRFVEEVFYPGAPPERKSGTDSVYLFDASGRPVPIGLARLWDSADQIGTNDYEIQH